MAATRTPVKRARQSAAARRRVVKPKRAPKKRVGGRSTLVRQVAQQEARKEVRKEIAKAKNVRKSTKKAKRFETPMDQVVPLFAAAQEFVQAVDLSILHNWLTAMACQILMRTSDDGFYRRALGDNVTVVSVKGHLFRYLYWYAVEVGAYRNTNAATQNPYYFGQPSKGGAVPAAFAKLMQYFAPYTDPETGSKTQLLLQTNAEFTISDLTTDPNASTSDMAHISSDFGLIYNPVATNASVETHWQDDTNTIGWETIATSFATFDALIRSSGLPFVEYGKIPKFAPDGSGVCIYVGGSTAGAYVSCPVPKFDSEIAVFFKDIASSLPSTSGQYAFFKPIPILPLEHLIGGTDSSWKYVAAGMSVLSMCPFHPGTVKKMLRQHPCSGVKGRALKSMYPVLRSINWGVISRLAHTCAVQILTGVINDEEWLRSLGDGTISAPPNETVLDLYYSLMIYFHSALFSRCVYNSTTAQFLQKHQTEPIMHLFFVGTKWLGVPLPVVLLDLDRELGCAIYEGKAVMPLFDLGNVASTGVPLLASGAEYIRMSVARDFGHGAQNEAGMFPAQAATALTVDYVVNLKTMNATTGNYNGTTTFPTLIPIHFASFFIKQVGQYKMTNQFLEEKLSVLGGNMMLCSVNLDTNNSGGFTNDLLFGAGSAADLYLAISAYPLINRVSSAMPISREDTGRALVLCPFFSEASDTHTIVGAGRYDLLEDPYDPITEIVEVTLADEESVFAKKVAVIAAEKENMLQAIRTALGPIYGNLVPEDPFLTDGLDKNWRKACWNMDHVSSAPYHRIRARDFSQFNSPSFYQKVFKGIRKMPREFHKGYRKLVDFAGKELPSDIGSSLNAWNQLISEQSKNPNSVVGLLKASAVLA